MGMLEEIRTYLIAQNVGVDSATKDWCVHLKKKQAVRHAVVVVYETGGTRPDMGFGSSTPRFKFPGLMVHTRGEPEDYDNPRARILLAYNALIAVSPSSPLSGTEYQMILANQEPFPMGQDELERYEFSCNFSVQKEPS